MNPAEPFIHKTLVEKLETQKGVIGTNDGAVDRCIAIVHQHEAEQQEKLAMVRHLLIQGDYMAVKLYLDNMIKE